MDNICTNSLWNKIFHRQQVKNNKARAIEVKNILSKDFENKINSSSDLKSLYGVHKDLWHAGYQNDNIGPCSYGIFRTKDINTMIPDEIYLGGIWGLNTNNIPFWEDHRNEDYGSNGFGISENIKLYTIIVNQYKNHLLSNYKSIKNNLKEEYKEYLNKNYYV